MGYMNDSATTKIANAEFLDLDNNKLSKQGIQSMHSMEIDHNDNNDNHNTTYYDFGSSTNDNKSTTTSQALSGVKRTRNETNIDNDLSQISDYINKPKDKKRKFNKKKFVKKLSKKISKSICSALMAAFDEMNIDDTDDENDES